MLNRWLVLALTLMTVGGLRARRRLCWRSGSSYASPRTSGLSTLNRRVRPPSPWHSEAFSGRPTTKSLALRGGHRVRCPWLWTVATVRR